MPLEDGRARNAEILATLGSSEGPWINGLRDLASRYADQRLRGREAAHGSWRRGVVSRGKCGRRRAWVGPWSSFAGRIAPKPRTDS